MELAAIFHRPESEDAFLHTDGRFYIRLRTKKSRRFKSLSTWRRPLPFRH